MTWMMPEAHMGAMKNLYKILVKKPNERDYLGEQGTDGRLIFKKQGARMWTGFIWLRRGSS
jgi:hypothetical protein